MNVKILLISIIAVLIIIFSTTQTTYAQENDSINTPEPVSDVSRENLLENAEKILSDSQRSFDRSIGILDMVVGSINVLVSLMLLISAIVGIIIAIAVACGIFEYKRWRLIRKKAEENANYIEKIKKSAEIRYNELLDKLKEKPLQDLTKNEFKDMSERLEYLEALGAVPKEKHFINGLKHYKDKNYELALKAFNEAISIEPNDADAWINRGVSLSKLGRHEEALEAIDKAISIEPNDTNAWFNRACIWSVRGEKQKSLSDLEKAIEFDKSYKEKAKKDKDFKKLWGDKDFKKITS